MLETTITNVRGREIVDSRGNPTVEVDVELEGGAIGRAAEHLESGLARSAIQMVLE